MNSEIVAILAGLGAMIGWGLADFLAKGTIDAIGDLASLYWGHILGALIIVGGGISYLVIAGGSADLPSDLAGWIGLAAFGAGQALVYLLVYRAFSKGPVSMLSPIFASYSGIAALLSVAFGEAVGLATGLVLILMFFGVLIASLEGRAGRGSVLAPGVPEALLGAGVAAVWTFGWDRFVHGHGWLSYSLVMYAGMTGVVALVAVFSGISRALPEPSVLWALVMIGTAEVCAYLSVSVGFSQTQHATSVAVIGGAFSIPTVLLARRFLNERLSPTRLVGVSTVIFAAALLPIAT